MTLPIFYAQLKRMAINTALDIPTARDIVRRAGLFLQPPRTLGLLLVADGEEQVPTGGDTPVVYSTQLVNGSNYELGASSWAVPEAGLYRATATLVIGTPSDEGIFGHAHVGLTSGTRAVMQQFHYVPPTTSPPPDRIVLSGAGTIYLEAGESASHVFYTVVGEPGNILQDETASRIYVESVL